MSMQFSEDIIELVWQMGRVVEGYDAGLFRQDACGAWIMRDKYGEAHHIFGWVIDHIYPRCLGGSDVLQNLRPLHYRNNLSKSDDYPSYTAVVTAEGNSNIFFEKTRVVNASKREELEKLYHC